MGRRIHKPSIFQGQLQFPDLRGARALRAEHPVENAAFKSFAFVLFALIFTYIFLVGSSAFNIIARKEALAQSARVGASIGSYEREYFAASQKVTPEEGVALGLAPVVKTAYIYRPGTVGRVEASHNEI